MQGQQGVGGCATSGGQAGGGVFFFAWLCCVRRVQERRAPPPTPPPLPSPPTTPHAQLNLTDCPYMWPHCRQPLYAHAMPLMFNATVLNGMGLTGRFEAPPAWTPADEGGRLLDVRFEYSGGWVCGWGGGWAGGWAGGCAPKVAREVAGRQAGASAGWCPPARPCHPHLPPPTRRPAVALVWVPRSLPARERGGGGLFWIGDGGGYFHHSLPPSAGGGGGAPLRGVHASGCCHHSHPPQVRAAVWVEG